MDQSISPELAKLIQESIANQVNDQVAVIKAQMKQEMQEEIKKQVQQQREDILDQLKTEFTNKMVSQVNKSRSPVRMTSSMSNAKIQVKPAIKPFNSGANDRTSPVRKVVQTDRNTVPIAKRYPNPANAQASASRSPMRMSFKESRTESTNQKLPSVSPRKMVNYQPKYEIKSLPNDVIDPIYENVDPIGVTSKRRMQEGSANSQVPGRKEAFFFNLELVGSGAPIIEKQRPKTGMRMMNLDKGPSPSKSFAQNGQNNDLNDVIESGGNDPISSSIKERTDAGSPFQTIRNKTVFVSPEDVTVLALNGQGLSMEKFEASQRRSAKERKANGVNYIAPFAKK